MNRMNRGMAAVAAICLTALVAACGGGGGAAGQPLPPVNSAPNSQGAAVPLRGVVTYDSVPNIGGALAYAETVRKPVRGAVVEALDAASRIVATTRTDVAGAYVVDVPANNSVSLRVRAQLSHEGPSASWEVSVRDNTRSDAIYALEVTDIPIGSAPVTRDVHAPSGWDGTRYASARVAAPFAMLDTIHDAQAKMLSVVPDAKFVPLRVFWSQHNLPADGNPALGQIGSTHFQRSGPNGPAIYMLGKEDLDTDEYDTSVIAHEWAHYYQANFSRNDSPGGSHSMAESLDARLAFSEGWANAWAGIALDRSDYTDSLGTQQARGLRIDLAAGASSNPGWHREASIQSVLWTLNSRVGFRPIHDAFTGDLKTGPALTSIHSFAAAFGRVAPAHGSQLAELLARERISAALNDPFGEQETNDGGLPGNPGALPLYRPASVGGTTSVCVSNRRGTGNKLGTHAFLRFTVTSARNHTLHVSGPAAADPDLVVYGGRQLSVARSVGSTETLALRLAAGEHVLALNDFNNSSAATCFAVSIV
ncbi:hypothetical protein QTH90_03725 [Variovorax sp. J2P1-59]|uniref:hypothetical protein n=1 Tax=Variovorax flavidus TaxID=3053501 RepID=UPI002577CCFF|nr:hypothetical protein [Variovorax sp. J2P1-59]MDM0073475.1 hypothetical protein [Variovorax sp. J2P1-59]